MGRRRKQEARVVVGGLEKLAMEGWVSDHSSQERNGYLAVSWVKSGARAGKSIILELSWELESWAKEQVNMFLKLYTSTSGYHAIIQEQAQIMKQVAADKSVLFTCSTDFGTPYS